ncbi:MAG: AI-2E family transporter [Bacteroidales bacterium]|jgi:predicted PurR-regulated permease PerM|nr:AI-2E family transporter [Bacteroidales bacterium]MDY0368434.1 AI-2E family transporter [Bacteroidales bacterium]
MQKNLSGFKTLFTLLVAAVLIWYYSDLVYFIAVAIVLSIVMRPVKQLFQRIQIKNLQIGNTLASILSLLVMLLLIVGFFAFVGPMIVNQASLISTIDTGLVGEYFRAEIDSLFDWLYAYKIIDPGQDLGALIEKQVQGLVGLANFSFVFGRLISTASSIFMAVFIVLFLSFFFIKEPWLIKRFILFFTPKKFEAKIEHIITTSRHMLTRYFIGLLAEITAMSILISVGLQLMGVHNALLIGFLGGLMNIIPYLGPLIGAAIGLFLGIVYVLSMHMFDQLIFTFFAIIGSFVAANLIDNLFLQPIIYSKSVKAHPVEIFLIIIMAGKFAGIVGMIAAIPVYTVVRIVVRQFSHKEINLPLQ